VKIYADSSYLLQFLTPDFATATAIAMHRRLGRPSYLFIPLHDLEVPNALRLKLFASARLPASARSTEKRAVADGFRRLKHYLETRCFRRAAMDWDVVSEEARALSELCTAQMGARSFDLLHVAAASHFKAESFLTCDRGQGVVAKAAGLKVSVVEP
jgi:hypothetical protein